MTSGLEEKQQMTQHEILLHKVEGRILTYLYRIKTMYERPLHNIVGRGVTSEEFTSICNKLVEKGVVTRAFGPDEAPILRWVQ